MSNDYVTVRTDEWDNMKAEFTLAKEMNELLRTTGTREIKALEDKIKTLEAGVNQVARITARGTGKANGEIYELAMELLEAQK